jgi:hypothetical protein
MRLVRYILFALRALLIAAVAFYALDTAIFQVRKARGGGMDTVTVDQFLSTALKGSKTEYDYLGSTPQSCSQSVAPQYSGGWNVPCWWLRKHTTKWQ